MRRASNIDKSHKAIVKQVRASGYRVFDTAAMGAGFPDMVVMLKNGRVAMLFENKPEERGEVTKAECTFMMQIVLPVYRMVDTPEKVIDILQGVESDEVSPQRGIKRTVAVES